MTRKIPFFVITLGFLTICTAMFKPFIMEQRGCMTLLSASQRRRR